MLDVRSNKVVTAEQMRKMDQAASNVFGVSSLILMENAGRAVAEVVVDALRKRQGNSVVVVAGQGNNGGDGFVAARHLHNTGVDVTIAFYGLVDAAKGDALTNIEIARKMGLEIVNHPDVGKLSEIIRGADVVVDALLGTGLKGEVRDALRDVIETINDLSEDVFVIAVDVPSGMDSDTGQELGVAVRCDMTVALGLGKIGLYTYPGVLLAGDVIVADIGLPLQVQETEEPEIHVLNDVSLLPLVLPRPREAHKGDFGHVAIVAGSVGMTGAAALAAAGSLAVGAGLVTVAIPESLNDILEVKLTEAMTVPVPEGPGRAFGKVSVDGVLEIIEARDAAVIGPGLGRGEETVEFVRRILPDLTKPTLLDADALFALAGNLDALRKAKCTLILTPHPGEMARLIGTSVEQVQSNRLNLAREFADKHNVWIVLKGPNTVIAAPDGDAFICPRGTPGMASGGVGDVLSGMIGGLLASGCDAVLATCCGVYAHGVAGEFAARKRSEVSMTASDLVECIPAAIKNFMLTSDERE